MISQDPQNLLNPALYQIFLMSCRCSLPFSFARHHWFIVNRKGALSRWEILFQKDCCGKSWGHLHLNAKNPFESLGFFSFKGSSIWKPEINSYIEGDTGSSAETMAKFIESSESIYPYCQKYLFWGPNSNTYIQWILDHSPEFKASLPWNAFGKNYVYAG